MWVTGELARTKAHANGHLYFDLVEKGDGDRIVGTLSAVLWRNDAARVTRELARSGQRLAEGLAVRCRVSLDFWPAGGRLQARVLEIDASFGEGLLARRRRETIAALAESGLLEANKRLPLPVLPLELALVTSQGSAAYHDFLSTLRESGFGFRVLFLHATVQGKDAEREVVAALAMAAAAGAPLVALVRGGGSRSDLAAFDSRAIAEAVARSPIPVLTGLGHEIDQSVADLAAHTAAKTPTKVAELLVERLRGAELALERLGRAVPRAAGPLLGRARERVLAAEKRALGARLRLGRLAARLAALGGALGRLGRSRLRAARRASLELARRLGRSASRPLAAGEQRRAGLAGRLGAAARGRLAVVGARLEGLGRLAQGFAPERTLARGFSITRAPSGRAVRSPAEVAAGERITSRVAGGAIVSRVEGA